MDSKLNKAMNAVKDAQQHLSSVPDLERLECQYIDRMLAKIVDLPTDSKQKNTRRNLQMIRDWMVTDGPGVVLLEVLGQLYWRLGDLNAKDFEALRKSLRQNDMFIALVQNPRSTALVVQRVKHVQTSKFNAFDVFMQEVDSKYIGFIPKRWVADLTGNPYLSPVQTPKSSPRSQPHSQPMTRINSYELSPQLSISSKDSDIADTDIDNFVQCMDAPISTGLGIFDNNNLSTNSLEHVLLDFCEVFDMLLRCHTNPTQISTRSVPGKHSLPAPIPTSASSTLRNIPKVHFMQY